MSSANVEFWRLGKKIVGAGLNYKAMCKDMNIPPPEEPIIFLKPPSSYIVEGQNIEIPAGFIVKEEIELGVVIGKRCKNIKSSEVLDHVAGYCLALDLTATNVLGEARSKGMPWCIGKGFDTSCPVSGFIPKEAIPNPDNVQLWCKVNGQMKQEGNTSDMICPVGELISYISQYFTLEPYDLILTGTTKGVTDIIPGDVIEAGIDNLVNIKFAVTASK